MKGNRTRVTVIVGVVAVIALALVSWFIVLSPRLSEAAQIQNQAEQLGGANLGLHNEYNRAVKMAKDAPGAAKEAQDLFATMPETANQDVMIEQIMGAAQAAGIPAPLVDMISTGLPKPVQDQKTQTAGADAAVAAGVNLATMQIDISAGGTPDQIAAFLDNLQALDRALLITSTQIANNHAADSTAVNLPAQSLKVGGTLFVLESKLPDLVASVETLIPKDMQASASPAAGAAASPSATPSSAAASSSSTPASSAAGAATPLATPSAAPGASSTPVPLQP